MKLDKDSRRLSKELFRASFTDGRLDDAKVRTIAAKVIESRPRHFLGVLKDFQRQVRIEKERRHALIESAQPLDEALRGQILGNLKQKYGTDITAEFREDPGLLGGLRIKLGSDVWDGSVRARLNRLESNLLNA